MKLFTKKETVNATGSSITRISSMDTNELYRWFSTTLVGLGRSFDLWRYEDGPDEIESHLEILNELWKEISHRSNGN